jgi:hypothetical protein
MSTKNQGPVTLDPNTVAAATMLTAGPTNTPAQEALMSLLAEELLRTKKKREEDERIQKAAREANINEIKKTLAQRNSEQNACIHRKPPPSHASALAGQRTHRGTVVFICQYCQKEFTEKTIPPDLHVPGDTIGGPQL